MRYATIRLDDGSTRVARLNGAELDPLESFSRIDSTTTIDALASARAESGRRYAAESVRYEPVASPRKIICVGLNYHTHIGETGRDIPEYPVLFTKFASSLVGHEATIQLPPESAQVDYEAELAVIIGAPARRVKRSEALRYVLGYTIANDVTIRDFQYKTHQWLQGKAWDNSTPVGPVVVTPDEFDPADADIRLRLNGVELQSSNTSQMIFDVATLIEVTSAFTALEPGDMILTGTPGGVGFRRDPPVFLSDNDVVEVEITGLGVLRNTVLSESVEAS